MRTLLKLIGILLMLVLLAGGYLFVRHPFVFQELSMISLLVNPPQFPKADPAIDTLSELDAFIAEQLAVNGVRGAAVALVTDGAVLWQKGYGLANAETGLAATADTPFMIGSVSKAVMGVATMHAVESGAVDLDAPINDTLDFAVNNPHLADSEPITLRHLATHTSGISDDDWVYANSYGFGDPHVDLGTFMRAFLVSDGATYAPDNFLDAPVGGAVEYSNIGAGLAGHVLGEATGERLDTYARRHVFAPLGMGNTGWFLADFADTSVIAQPYGIGNRPFPHYGYPTWPDGQLRASANDLARLLAMVMNGGELDGVRILEEATVNDMLAKQTFSGLSEVSGEGIFWSYTKQGMIGHNGGDPGVTSAMYFDPESRIGVVVMTNANIPRGTVPVFSIVRQVVEGEKTADIVSALQ